MAELANKAESRLIAQDLRAKIADGTYPVGSPLPSYTEIEDRYKATRDVARRAVRLLRDEGIVATVHGIGTEVVALPTGNPDEVRRPGNIGQAIRLVVELRDEVRTQSAKIAALEEAVSRLESARPADRAPARSPRPRQPKQQPAP